MPAFILSMQLQHLHNVEKRLYCSQTFLYLNFQCRDSELNRRFGIEKSHYYTCSSAGGTQIS